MRLLYCLKYATLYTGLCIMCVTHKSKGGSEWGEHQKNCFLKCCRMRLSTLKYSAGIGSYFQHAFSTRMYFSACSHSTDAEFLSAIEYGLRCLSRKSFSLKPKQLETVRQVCHGKDVFLWLQTRFRKAFCYEVLPFVIDYRRGKRSSERESPHTSFSTVVVVSPLVSLMVDQVTCLQGKGVSAGILTRHSAVSDQLLIKPGSIDKYSFVL